MLICKKKSKYIGFPCCLRGEHCHSEFMPAGLSPLFTSSGKTGKVLKTTHFDTYSGGEYKVKVLPYPMWTECIWVMYLFYYRCEIYHRLHKGHETRFCGSDGILWWTIFKVNICLIFILTFILPGNNQDKISNYWLCSSQKIIIYQCFAQSYRKI